VAFFKTERALAFVAIAAVIAILPAFFPAYISFELTYVAAYAIAILGLMILTGYNGQISLGHGAFLAAGGYTLAILVSHAGVPILWTIPIAAVVCAVFGTLIGLAALRLEGAYLALSTFALAVSVPSVIKRFSGLTGGNTGITLAPVTPPAFLHGFDAEKYLYYCAWILTAVIFLVTSLLLRGRLGRSLRALRDNHTAAIAFGINPYFYKTLAFAWSAAYAGIAGALVAIATAYVSPDVYNLTLSTTLLIGLVLGGIDTMWGALLGGVIVEFLPLWAQKINSGAPAIVQGVALILVMLLMPGGVAGGIGGLVRRIRTTRGPATRDAGPSVAMSAAESVPLRPASTPE
jgi:branched-chain amino acid transport system permease protein